MSLFTRALHWLKAGSLFAACAVLISAVLSSKYADADGDRCIEILFEAGRNLEAKLKDRLERGDEMIIRVEIQQAAGRIALRAPCSTESRVGQASCISLRKML